MNLIGEQAGSMPSGEARHLCRFSVATRPAQSNHPRPFRTLKRPEDRAPLADAHSVQSAEHLLRESLCLQPARPNGRHARVLIVQNGNTQSRCSALRQIGHALPLNPFKRCVIPEECCPAPSGASDTTCNLKPHSWRPAKLRRSAMIGEQAGRMPSGGARH